jgi:hypothetical protein
MVNLPFLKKKEEEKSFKEMSEHEQKHALETKDIADKLKLLKLGDQEQAENAFHKKVETSFPAPIKRLRLQLKDPNHNPEGFYHGFMLNLTERLGLNKRKKIIDSMGLSVGSSMFGNLQTRLAAQQNQASQYLKGISEMIKGMFQIVREIRILDERLQFYKDSESENSELSLSSEIVLKGLWIDQVEGGSKNPSSVYGLAQTVGFTILPDVFFRTKPMKKKEIEKVVDSMKFNEKVKEVLKRKLRQFYEWKERTKDELETRRKFVVKYLRQHYTTIKLYMSWITPYLRHIRRIRQTDEHGDDINVVTAFETAIIELETIHWRTGYGSKPFDYNAVVVLNFHYLVLPELAFHHYEYQHRGPIHAGKFVLAFRAYAWTTEQIENYIKYRNEEELELMKEINSSIEEAMDALGDDLKKYLKSAGEKFPDDVEEKKEPVKLPSIFAPFAGVFGGFGELFQSFNPFGFLPKGSKKKEKEPKKDYKDERQQKRAGDYARLCVREAYQKFKETKGLLHW